MKMKRGFDSIYTPRRTARHQLPRSLTRRSRRRLPLVYDDFAVLQHNFRRADQFVNVVADISVKQQNVRPLARLQSADFFLQPHKTRRVLRQNLMDVCHREHDAERLELMLENDHVVRVLIC